MRSAQKKGKKERKVKKKLEKCTKWVVLGSNSRHHISNVDTIPTELLLTSAKYVPYIYMDIHCWGEGGGVTAPADPLESAPVGKVRY